MEPSVAETGRLTLHFVYSFILTGDVDVVATVISNLDRWGLRRVQPPQHAFQPYLSLRRSSAVVEPAVFGTTSAPIGAQNRGQKVEVCGLGGDPRTARLSRRFLLDRSGASAYVVELEVEGAPPALETMVQFASAAEQRALRLLASGECQCPAGYCWCPPLSPPSANGLYLLFKRDVAKLAERCGNGANWLDDPDSEASVVEEQLPFVLTVIRLGDQREFVDLLPYDGAFSPPSAVDLDTRRRRFAALLFRWKTVPSSDCEDVDLTFLNAAEGHRGSVLANAHIHRDLFVANNIRSCVIASNLSARPTSGPDVVHFTVPDIEATVAADRAQWHAYLVINALLERDADDLSGELRNDPATLLRRLVQRRRLLLKVLDATTSYRLASDTLWGLHRHIVESLGVSDLRQQALAKMAVLDDLIANTRQAEMLAAMSDIGRPSGLL